MNQKKVLSELTELRNRVERLADSVTEVFPEMYQPEFQIQLMDIRTKFEEVRQDLAQTEVPMLLVVEASSEADIHDNL